ncbi:MAG: hypothetical protein ABIL69_02740 [candidate division WOR-3 bacterium]
MTGVFLIIISLSNISTDSVIAIDRNYFVDGIHGLIGGAVGFGSVAYITFFSLSLTDYSTGNFAQELGYVFGYTVGMPICASSFIHFSPYNKNHSKKSFIQAIKNSFIGAQLGLCTILITSHISRDTKYWAGLFILPLPIIGAVMGHNTLPLETNYKSIDNEDNLMKTNTPKLYLKIFKIDLK